MRRWTGVAAVLWLHTPNVRSKCNPIPFSGHSCLSDVSFDGQRSAQKLCGALTFSLFSCFPGGVTGIFAERSFLSQEGLWPLGLLQPHLVRSQKQAQASLLVCLQLRCSYARHKKDTLTPKKACCLIPGFLTSLKSTTGGAGRICQGVGHRWGLYQRVTCFPGAVCVHALLGRCQEHLLLCLSRPCSFPCP